MSALDNLLSPHHRNATNRLKKATHTMAKKKKIAEAGTPSLEKQSR